MAVERQEYLLLCHAADAEVFINGEADGLEGRGMDVGHLVLPAPSLLDRTLGIGEDAAVLVKI